MDNDATKPTQIEYYKIIRDRMDHENELIVHRLSWFVTAQSFLFTAYGLSLQQRGNDPQDIHLLAQLRWLIPVVAFSIAILIYSGILAGVAALWEDRSLFNVQRKKVQAEFPDFPKIRSPEPRFWSGLVAPLLLPPLLIFAWLFLWYQSSL